MLAHHKQKALALSRIATRSKGLLGRRSSLGTSASASTSAPATTPQPAKSKMKLVLKPRTKSGDHAFYAETLLALTKKQALTSEDKYKILEARDKLLRKLQSKVLIKRSHLTGKCPDMCPEKERYHREITNQVAIYERLPVTEEVKMDHLRAVKQYSRSSADQDDTLCHELRPAAVLERSMDYLLGHIMDIHGRDSNLHDWFHFLWDRTRSIRKDITQQELCEARCVALMEQCTRFHIHCAEQLVEEDPAVFDQKINTENLTKCLQTLKYMYEDMALKGQHCPCEAEFRAYTVLLNLNDSNFIWDLKRVRPNILHSNEVQFALRVHAAIHSQNYIKFFKLVRQTSYLNACLLQRYFSQVRISALISLCKTSCPSRVHILLIGDYLTPILKFLFLTYCWGLYFCLYDDCLVNSDICQVLTQVMQKVESPELILGWVERSRRYVAVTCYQEVLGVNQEEEVADDISTEGKLKAAHPEKHLVPGTLPLCWYSLLAGVVMIRTFMPYLSPLKNCLEVELRKPIFVESDLAHAMLPLLQTPLKKPTTFARPVCIDKEVKNFILTPGYTQTRTPTHPSLASAPPKAQSSVIEVTKPTTTGPENNHVRTFPVGKLMKLLAFESLAETCKFLDCYGLTEYDTEDKKCVVMHRGAVSMPKLPPQMYRAPYLIESKMTGITLVKGFHLLPQHCLRRPLEDNPEITILVQIYYLVFHQIIAFNKVFSVCGAVLIHAKIMEPHHALILSTVMCFERIPSAVSISFKRRCAPNNSSRGRVTVFSGYFVCWRYKTNWTLSMSLGYSLYYSLTVANFLNSKPPCLSRSNTSLGKIRASETKDAPVITASMEMSSITTHAALGVSVRLSCAAVKKETALLVAATAPWSILPIRTQPYTYLQKSLQEVIDTTAGGTSTCSSVTVGNTGGAASSSGSAICASLWRRYDGFCGNACISFHEHLCQSFSVALTKLVHLVTLPLNVGGCNFGSFNLEGFSWLDTSRRSVQVTESLEETSCILEPGINLHDLNPLQLALRA
ncbi:hypothetical protein PR048_032813 [Dryococelus australis]|uniref:SAC3/GANP/THP3 conserved domain-containing protein n=1 Tax=Dryococelus australis TaxID=614101 RepID=A0ABQ9G641_9NEOP|nr:hypothetical protein PR048_032813 [Dryococelus australis]